MTSAKATRRQAPEAAGRTAAPARQPVAASPFLSADERQEERERKREALLQAAVRMFNARGFHATSLDDVAASLGATKPVIYRYLGNKDQVLLECVTRGITQLQEAAAAARQRPGSGLDRLRAFLCRYAEIAVDDFGMCVIRTDAAALSPQSAKQFRAAKRRIDSAMRALIAEAVADGSAHAPDVRDTAFALAGALNWTAHWYRPGGGMPPAEMARRLVDILTLGLQPRHS
ncbi:TetR/AcrR family transcriptional regulator [Rhodovastum atsumiense]|uniref:TetR/AcrR family transcriptional regulator n=1 Tax=Rhodovastum atsumiense TaxID=504468 RepID=A0A5M6J3A4_9PROT|nr:TetR/AcrR family transcriptional regulator [Rhodovastum atsumiense]KAA5614135.1 TetR/AcrR family transcriptional regulator [Rhodovastum atsumiense]CAH2598985.1 TetR/AcrR family transcriptional regulator [Rhodovastum atsumiense]